jgi:hypothetical protein
MSDHSINRPGGFIFHTGRCGSTLLANMLAADGARAVLKEPEAISDLVAELLLAIDDDTRRKADRALVVTLGTLSAAAWLREAPAFKFAAWNVRVASSLLEHFPETPAAFLYRGATETVASLMNVPPGWRGLMACPRSVQACFFPTLRDVPAAVPLSPEEFYAHGWISNVDAVLDLPPDRLTFVNYDELSADLHAAFARILDALRIESSPSSLAAMLAAAKVYSKDARNPKPFDPMGAHRRPPLPAAEESRVRAMTASRFEELERRRGLQSRSSA